MGYLAAAGAYLIIGLVVSFILMVVGLFIGHIIVFDSIALGIISGVCCNHFFTLHPALCVLIGAAVFALLLFLQNTRFGFWVIGVLLSAAWAVIFGLLAFIISWYFSRDIKPNIGGKYNVKEIVSKGNPMIFLGIMLVLSYLIDSVVANILNIVIRMKGSMSDVGLYQAAMSISAMSINMVFVATGTSSS